jgi:hypothetical protein
MSGSDTFGGSSVSVPAPGVVHVAEPVSYGSGTPGPLTLCRRSTQFMTPRPEWRVEFGWRPPSGGYCLRCRDEADRLLAPL